MAEAPKATRVAVVSVHYYPEYRDDSLAVAESIVGDTEAGVWMPVANRPDLSLRPRANDATPIRLVAHDNRGREFGAYQAGLDALANTDDWDWVVFLNDTLGLHAPFHATRRARLRDTLRRWRGVDRPVAVGEEERWPSSYALEGLRTHRWLTTNLFALNRRALQALSCRIHRPDIDSLVAGRGATPREFFSPALDENLAAHLANWLFGPSTGGWYGGEPLSEASADRLAGKARCILQEKFLAARLEEAGTWFCDLKGAPRTWERLRLRWDRLAFRTRGPSRPSR